MHKHQLFTTSYKQDYPTQGKFLVGLLHIGRVNRCRLRTYEDSFSSCCQATICYSSPNGTGDQAPVRKSTFMDIFVSVKKWLDILIRKMKAVEVTNVQGMHRADLQKTEVVTNHFNSFPRKVGHYTRGRSNKEYLSQALNKSRLYLHYKKVPWDNSNFHVIFRKVFLWEFQHLQFQKPCKDNCNATLLTFWE